MMEAIQNNVVNIVPKICCHCKVQKERTEFYIRKMTKDGLRHECKECTKIEQRAFNKRNPEKLRQRNKEAAIKYRVSIRANRKKHSLKKYGINWDIYHEMIKAQNGLCKICSIPMTKDKTKAGASVDHCHKTGMVRGIICMRCNFGLGYFRDSPEFLGSAIKYLQETGGNHRSV